MLTDWLKFVSRMENLSKMLCGALNAKCSRKTSSKRSKGIRTTLNPGKSAASRRRLPGNGCGKRQGSNAINARRGRGGGLPCSCLPGRMCLTPEGLGFFAGDELWNTGIGL